MLGLEISGDIDGEALRAAIGGELGVATTDAGAFAPGLGRLAIAIGGGSARIAYRPAAGTLVERTVELPAAAQDRIDLVTYIATNLVRDQASEVLANLPPRPVIVIPPRDAPPPPSRPRVVRWPATIGFVPPLAADRLAGADVEVEVGIHALVGATYASDIFSVSGLVDRQRDHATGLQIGGLAAAAGRLDNGLQIGGLAAYAEERATGLQIGGLAAYAHRRMDGLQIAGLASGTSGDLEGGQIAGIASLARGTMHGLQIAGITSIADRVRGVQIAGIANVGRDVDGVQIGVVNVARTMHGVQVGVVNLSDDGDDSYPIGLINYSRNGALSVDGWVDSSRLSGAELRHGTRHIHNVWGVAWSPDHDHLLAGAGLGLHTGLAGGIGFDLDAVNWWTDVWNGNFGQLEQLRATVAVPLGSVELIGGAAANVYISDEMDESANFHPVAARRYTSDSGVHVVSWPSVFAGVRLRAR